MVKILDVRVKVQDDKGHIKNLTIDDVDINSIILKGAKPKRVVLEFAGQSVITSDGDNISFTEPHKKKNPKKKHSKSS